ncbi:MAG: hypothetical protein QXN93_00165 [Methanomassiliicoccales archaeon]
MLFRKKSSNDDGRNEHSIQRQVYRVAEIDEGDESKKIKSTKIAYSFWSAVKYIFILSFLLWWLPILGQMIAGYVGGRRAGSPWKGALAALLPLAIIFALTSAIDAGWIPTTIGGINITPGAIMGVLASSVPFLDSYINFASLYLNSFVSLLQSTISFRLDSYIITIAFAYIGGIIADQTRREMEYVSRHGGPRTTVVVEGGGVSHLLPQNQGVLPALNLRSRARNSAMVSFEDLQALTADAEFGDEDLPPLRYAHKLIEKEVDEVPISPKEKKLIDRRARIMAKKQKTIERKVKKKGKLPDGLVNRALAKSRTNRLSHNKNPEPANDWEFM